MKSEIKKILKKYGCTMLDNNRFKLNTSESEYFRSEGRNKFFFQRMEEELNKEGFYSVPVESSCDDDFLDIMEIRTRKDKK